jgi:hypothetical protein
MDASQWRDAEVMRADNGQAQAEGGCRVRKEPRFLVSSVCVNKPCRMQGLLMVLT